MSNWLRCDSGSSPRTWLIAVLVLLVLWLPYSWLLFTDYPWSDYRWFWVVRWPVLPGLPSMLLVRPLGIESATAETICMGIMTVAIGLAAVLAGRQSQRWCIVALSILTAYGVFMLFASHAIFRA